MLAHSYVSSLALFVCLKLNKKKEKWRRRYSVFSGCHCRYRPTAELHRERNFFNNNNENDNNGNVKWAPIMIRTSEAKRGFESKEKKFCKSYKMPMERLISNTNRLGDRKYTPNNINLFNFEKPQNPYKPKVFFVLLTVLNVMSTNLDSICL